MGRIDRPVFIIGPPRCGTTYLLEILNLHSNIFITNETAVFLWLSKALNLMEDSFAVRKHGEEFRKLSEKKLPLLVKEFYRNLQKKEGVDSKRRWGDKFPHYAERDGGRCLEVIDKFWPKSQFILIVRDPRSVVRSILTRKMAPFEEGIRVWKESIRNGTEFQRKIGLDRLLYLRYEDLVRNPEKSVQMVFQFLNESCTEKIIEFVLHQKKNPIPYSNATSLGNSIAPWKDMDEKIVEVVEDQLKWPMSFFGYPPGREAE